MVKGRFLIAACLIVCLHQQASSQEDGDASPLCPPLTTRSVRVVCENRGQPIDCASNAAGTVARTVWKKSVIKQSKGVTNIVCKKQGVWKKSNALTKIPGGYEKRGNLGYFKIPMVAAPFDVAEAACKQDGAHVMVIDTNEKLDLIEKIFVEKNPFFLYSVYAEDVFAGISNNVDKQSFLTIYGKPPLENSLYVQRGGKTNAENSCVTYAMKKKVYWVNPCKQARGYICELSADTEKMNTGNGNEATGENGNENVDSDN